MRTSDSLQKLNKRLTEQFEAIDESAVVVLKGHLVIEEALDGIIGAFVFHPEFVENANLRFSQKVAVARSMSLDDHNNEMWELGVRINSLRNELAHSLGSEKRAAKAKAVIDTYEKQSADTPASKYMKDQPEHIQWSSPGFVDSYGLTDSSRSRVVLS